MARLWHSDQKMYSRKSVAKDSSRAWVIAAAAFFTHFIVLGFAFSIGVFYVEFLDVFGQSQAVTAWISSLNFGVLCGIGPLGSFLISKYGCRITLICGALVATAGLFMSAFAQNIYMMFLSLGLLAGSGFGLAFTTAVVVISFYFSRYRTVAMGISISGAGFGTFTYPWISRILLHTFAWRGALMICAGLNLHVVALAMLIPPEPANKNNNNVKSEKKMSKDSGKWKDALHINLFEKFAYITLCLNCLFFNFGLSVVYTHISAYAHSLDLGQNIPDVLISLLGLTNLIGRIALGVIGQLDFVNVPVLFLVSYFTAGLGIIVCGLWTTLPGVATSTSVFGFFSAAYGPLLSEVTCIIAGVEEFNHAYGYLMVFMAIGTVMGAPVAGWVYDITGIYPSSFYLGGTCIVLSCFLMVPSVVHMTKSSRSYYESNILTKTFPDVTIEATKAPLIDHQLVSTV